ncbi:TPA: methyltransferase [Candidatus Peribacteria bacterium]|nr:methyltransferase [Candidatus Peribacteria bacterium]
MHSSSFDSFRRTTCRICGSDSIYSYINLGDQPPSNSFIAFSEIPKEKTFPLIVNLCRDCGLSQLSEVVSSEDIFDDYLYLSSTSGALKRHYKSMIDAIIEEFKLARNSLAVDIGCNDGITLSCYPKDQYRVLGIEPSSAGKYAIAEGFNVIQAFFNKEQGKKIREEHGEAEVITATNVFAHVDDIISFAKGVHTLLDDDGIFVIEFPYLRDMVEQTYFDTIYHEHLSYFALTPLTRLFRDTGMRAFHVIHVDVGASGPALRLFVCRNESSHKNRKTITNMLEDEKKWGITRPERYDHFAAKVSKIRETLKRMIKALNKQGSKVGAFGAPAKGNTLLNYVGLTADEIMAVAENNELKVGKVTPGSHIPIVSDDEFLDADIPYAVLLIWNYADFFLKNSEYIKRGGKFIIPLPQCVIKP